MNESKYSDNPLLPKDAAQLARVRMAQMVTNNELSSLVIPLISEPKESPKLRRANRKITRILKFLAELLGENNYFGGDNISLGDIVAGNAVILVNKLGFEINQNQTIKEW